ncbi:MAG: GIY-YIG nuclease family protein [bacterium]
MPYYTYILYSESLNRYYIGSSENPEKRLERHNARATVSTRGGRPWKVVYKEQYDSRKEAISRENFIKRMKSRKFIQSLINSKG